MGFEDFARRLVKRNAKLRREKTGFDQQLASNQPGPILNEASYRRLRSRSRANPDIIAFAAALMFLSLLLLMLY